MIGSYRINMCISNAMFKLKKGFWNIIKSKDIIN